MNVAVKIEREYLKAKSVSVIVDKKKIRMSLLYMVID